jgi:hypothetical protein
VICLEHLLQTLDSCFAHSLKKHLKFTKLVEMLETKGIKFLERENKVALNVEPYQKVDGRIQNTLGENDIKQPYKLASQTKL